MGKTKGQVASNSDAYPDFYSMTKGTSTSSELDASSLQGPLLPSFPSPTEVNSLVYIPVGVERGT